MKHSSETEKPVSNWAVAGVAMVFAVMWLLWSKGFDVLCKWLSGGTIEAVLNWVTNAWYWIGLVAFVVALVVGSWINRK